MTTDEKPEFWKGRFLDALKALHEALDLLADIDGECLLTGHLKDRVDEALAPRERFKWIGDDDASSQR